MKNLFLPLFIFVSYIANAQFATLIDTNAVWRQGTKTCDLNGFTVECGGWNYIDFKTNSGDTIIGNYMYQKVATLLGLNISGPYAYLREDSGRVYMKYESGIEIPYYLMNLYTPNFAFDTTEFVLYDFNLQAGDTFTTKVFKCILLVSWLEFDTIQYSQDFIVNSTSTIILANGEERKKLSLSAIYDDIQVGQVYRNFPIEWIEGIGATTTFFYNERGFYSSCGAEGEDTGLRIACYSLNDSILWGVENCLFPTAVNENIAKENTQVFPNPVEDLLTIKSQINYTNYTVYNTLGSVVQSGTISTNSIDFSALSNGIYILSLIDKNTRHYRTIITK